MLFISLSHLLSLIIYPDDKLWFLWNLFFISVFYAASQYLSQKFNVKEIFCIIVTFAVMAVLSKVLAGNADSARICRLFPFYVLGHYCRQWIDKLKAYEKWAIPFLLICFFSFTFLWRIDSSCPDIVNNEMLNRVFASTPYRLFVCIIGCFTFLFIGHQFSSIIERTFLNKLGRKTLGIYAIHLIVLTLSPKLPILLNFWFSLLLYSFVLITSVQRKFV